MAMLYEAGRRNGYYHRHLLTELGDIELAVPRTRRFAPIAVGVSGILCKASRVSWFESLAR
jgi:hypothetical protein